MRLGLTLSAEPLPGAGHSVPLLREVGGRERAPRRLQEQGGPLPGSQRRQSASPLPLAQNLRGVTDLCLNKAQGVCKATGESKSTVPPHGRCLICEAKSAREEGNRAHAEGVIEAKPAQRNGVAGLCPLAFRNGRPQASTHSISHKRCTGAEGGLQEGERDRAGCICELAGSKAIAHQEKGSLWALQGDKALEETFEAGQALGTKFLEVCGRSYI